MCITPDLGQINRLNYTIKNFYVFLWGTVLKEIILSWT